MRLFVCAVVCWLWSQACGQPVMLVSGDDFAPYTDSKLAHGGMATELVTRAFAEVQREVTVQWRPWARGAEETKRGTFAATFPYLKTPEREQDFLYSDVLVLLRDRAYVKAGGRHLDFSNPASLAGTIYCLPWGWAASNARFADLVNAGHIKSKRPRDFSTCVTMVEAGLADYFITSELQGTAALQSAGTAAGTVVAAEGPPVSDNSLYLIAGKAMPGSRELIDAFNKGLKAIHKSGVYDQIVKAHTK